MKINREAKSAARKIFQDCLRDGSLDEARLRNAAAFLAEARPRRFAAILTHLERLTRLWVEAHTHIVRSAAPLPDGGKAALAALEKRCGPPIACTVEVDPALLGGMAVQAGSDLWDGSVRGRLRALARDFHVPGTVL